MSDETKGAQTKARILHIAATLFSQQSFDQVSVRAIAKAAQVDPALISHYFGSKEGLFAALLEEYSQLEHFERELFVDTEPSHLGRELIRKAETLWSSPAGRAMMAVMRRAFAGNTDTLRDVMTAMLLDKMAARLKYPEAERRLRVNLVASQMVGLVIARHIIQVEPLASLAQDEVVDLIGPTVQRYLTDPLTL